MNFISLTTPPILWADMASCMVFLAKDQDHYLPEKCPMGGWIMDHQTCYTGGGSTCKEGIKKGCMLPGSSGKWEGKKNGSQDNHSHESEDDGLEWSEMESRSLV